VAELRTHNLHVSTHNHGIIATRSAFYLGVASNSSMGKLKKTGHRETFGAKGCRASAMGFQERQTANGVAHRWQAKLLGSTQSLLRPLDRWLHAATLEAIGLSSRQTAL
jgi:hypothetical protein